MAFKPTPVLTERHSYTSNHPLGCAALNSAVRSLVFDPEFPVIFVRGAGWNLGETWSVGLSSVLTVLFISIQHHNPPEWFGNESDDEVISMIFRSMLVMLTACSSTLGMLLN